MLAISTHLLGVFFLADVKGNLLVPLQTGGCSAELEGVWWLFRVWQH